MSKILNMRVGTLNCRSIRTTPRLAELESAFQDVPFDIIGLTETRRTGPETLNLQQSGHLLFCSGQTGFLVHKRWAAQSSFHPLTERVSFLEVTTPVAIFRAVVGYAPTSAHSDDEFEDFLDSVVEALQRPLVHRRVRLPGLWS